MIDHAAGQLQLMAVAASGGVVKMAREIGPFFTADTGLVREEHFRREPRGEGGKEQWKNRDFM